jgi:hypothetical protein
MPPGKRKAAMDDTPTETDVLDEFVRSMQVDCDMQDTTAADRVYARFLSIAGPGQSVVNATVLPWAMGKRKTGVDDTPSESGILLELSQTIQDASGKDDTAAAVRVYERFLSQMERGVVSRYLSSLPCSAPGAHTTQDKDWTPPHPHPPSHL